MKDFNNILSDKEIRELFRQRLLETDMDDAINQKLIDMETQIAFSNDLLMMPDLEKEKQLLKKLSVKTGLGPMGKWLYTGLSAVLVATFVLIYQLNRPADIPEHAAPQSAPKINATPPEPQQQVSPVKAPMAAKAPQPAPPKAPAKQGVPAGSDSIPAEVLKEIEPLPIVERKPILNFVGATGVYKSFTKFMNDTGGIAVDTIFKGIKRVEIDGSFCDVHVKTHETNQVNLNGKMKFEFKGVVFRKPEYKLHYTQKDSVLTVWFDNTRKSTVIIAGSSNLSGYLDFVIPKQTALLIKNASGNVSVNGLEGSPCSIGSSYGDIRLENIKNKLEIHSSSGHVRLNDITGEIVCKAAYGNIDGKQLSGDLKITSSSGDVNISGLRGNLLLACSYGDIVLQDIGGNLSLSSASGNISLDNITSNKINIACSYGNVNVCNSTGSLTLKSSSGKISLKHMNGNITAHAGYGDMDLNDINGDLVLGSSSGHIRVNKIVGRLFIASSYGDVTASDCVSQVHIKSSSGSIKGKNIQLVKDLYVNAGYGDIHMNLKNDVSELSFDLSAGSGDLNLDKNGVKLKGKEGKLLMKNGDILVKSVSSSGNQTFD